MRLRRKSAFTLIELLCVLTIILILVSLMIGPVFKALKRVKQFEGEMTHEALVERFRDRMQKHLGAASSYPERSVEQLYSAGLIDTYTRDFLRKKGVHFFPFSSATPDTAPILMFEVRPGEVFTLLKADLNPRTD